jgi:serine phosphatase RsbU (regulator of sigma subunit)
MHDHRDPARNVLARIPALTLQHSLAMLTAIWIILLISDLLSGEWAVSPASFGLKRQLLPLLGLLPTVLRLIRRNESDREVLPFKTYSRLTLTSCIFALAIAVFGVVPFEYRPDGSPAEILSFAVGRIAGLLGVIALPLLTENLVLLYRFRSRGSAPRLAEIFVYGMIGTVLVAQFYPLDRNDGIGLPAFIQILSSVLALIGLVVAVRASWIINLKKRDKWGLLGLSVIGFPAASWIVVSLTNTEAGRAILSLAPSFAALLYVLGTSMLFLHMIIFVSALLSLPTADAIDRRNAEVSSLANFARLLTQSVDADHLIDTAISIACDVTAGAAAWIELRDGDTIQVLFGNASKLSPRIARQLMAIPVGHDLVLSQAVALQRRVEVVDKVTGLVGMREGGGPDLRSVAASPMQLGDQLLGTLYVAKERAGAFDREDIVVLSAVADQIALAIEQSRLIRQSIERNRFEQEMLIARDLQQRLLPKLMPESPYYTLHAESMPASLVGGDYYDVVSFSDGTLGILVADVSGKGASAALYMGMIKGIIQALSGRCESPRELLAQANVALHGHIDQRWFATMSCAQIIEERRMLRIARAGHCPTLLVRDGRTAFSRPKGLGLGIARAELFDKNLEIEEIGFAPGDYAIFYSDGLPEARSPGGDELGYERLQDLAAEAAAQGATPVEMRDAIFSEIARFAEDEPPADDSTLLILKWR